MRDDGFDKDTVQGAVDEIYKGMLPQEEKTSTEPKEKSAYSNDDLRRALTEQNLEAFRYVAGRMQEEGKSESAIRSAVVSWVKDNYDDPYYNMTTVLKEYGGFTKNDAQKKLDAIEQTRLEEALPEAVQAAAEAKYGGRYTEFESAVRELQGKGYSRQAVLGAINDAVSNLRPAKSKGDTYTEEQAYSNTDLKDAVARGDAAGFKTVAENLIKAGETDADKVEEVAVKYAKAAYMDTVDKTAARNTLTKFAGMSAEDADRKLAWWDYTIQYENGSMKEAAFVKYYDQIRSSGIPLSVYEKYYPMMNAATGEDKDGDGRADNGTKKAEICDIIDALKLTPEQKDVLYYAAGYSDTKRSPKPKWSN